MELPKPIIDIVQEGRAFLFLGSGACIGAIHPDGIRPPTGSQLAKKLAEKFLGAKFINYPLSQVAELAISEHDLFTVQEYIRDIFFDFYPSEFHKLIPKFFWRGIATTNYDLIIERAYDVVDDCLQYPVVFKKNGERIEEKLRHPKSVMYVKLHGCITDINDISTPLILTPDQYVAYRKGRNLLFERLQSFAYEYPFIFVGYSLSDPDIRAILLELTQAGDARPRSYIIAPEMTGQEVRYWESKKITYIGMSFEEFLNDLNALISPNFRALSIFEEKNDSPLFRKFSAQNSPNISESLRTFLNRDVDFIHNEFKTETADPKAFYKGYFVDWSPIAENLDVKRSLADSIMMEVILANEIERQDELEFFVLRGHAGAGKSVILKRIAWDAAIDFNKLCIYAKQSSFIEYEPISELYRICKERIYLFIDPLTEFAEIIEDIIPKARKDNIPLTIIAAVRHNEWNTTCEHLNVYLTDVYDVPYLSEKEIEGLIHLLTKHKSLGYLDGKTIEEQKEALAKTAGRQILVALHEATLGKPFSDIVLDEYNSILNRRAQSLYLTVCIFHRLRVPVRAGFISRVHGISFSVFEEELFKPLEFIVFARMNNIIRDYEYRSRHSHIAEIVFERVLTNDQDRFDEYIRIINAIDIDYSADWETFKGLTNARGLLSLFRNPQMIRQIYKAAHNRDENSPMLIQQEAIFEMNSSDGSLDKATKLLQRAYKIAPYNRAIAHSLSELALKKAEDSNNEVERNKYLEESKQIAGSLISQGTYTAHPYHTAIKVKLIELENILPLEDNTIVERKIKDIEQLISKVIQIFPDDSYIRQTEAEFCTLINRSSQALTALEKAFLINKRNSYLATRLSKVYEANGMNENALSVLKECVEMNPSDKYANFQLAMLLIRNIDSNVAEIKHHLRRSFTNGDSNYAAQFWYARLLYIEGSFIEAQEIFKTLSSVNIDTRIKKEPRGTIFEKGRTKRFSGVIQKIESTYAFISRDSLQDTIFAHKNYTKEEIWAKLRYQKRVTFDFAFNYKGPFALNICEE